MTAMMALVGTRAPEFTLPCTRIRDSQRDHASLRDYLDRWLVLMFYPRDFSMVCPTELTGISTRLPEFERRDCAILGISTDSLETHERWILTPRSQGGLGGLNYPLASDEDGSVCRIYGVYVPRQHLALRGLFIIDPNGVLQYQVVHNLSVGRSSDEVLRVLDGLQTGGLCPENWQPSEPTLDPSKIVGTSSVVGQYRIEAELGSGSFGSVFRAVDLLLQRSVALKILSPGSPIPADAILNEARAAAALNHPNVCTVYSVDTSDSVQMIVMEYVDGQPLSKLLEAGPLPVPQVISIGRQIAQGMAAAHAHGIAHRDLKPANIMVTAEGVVKIMDFGLARRDVPIMPSDATAVYDPSAPTDISGTPRYMSPEQVRNDPVSAASDVFSLGLIFYELLTGRPAIAGNSLFEILRRIDQVDPESLAAEVPEPFSQILRLALISDPHRREITMAHIADCLNA